MKIIAATAADCLELNKAIPPQRGERLGGGIHVDIPDDWLERIMRGEKVPGCRYFEPQAGQLVLADEAEAELAVVGVAKVDAILSKPDVMTAEPVTEEIAK